MGFGYFPDKAAPMNGLPASTSHQVEASQTVQNAIRKVSEREGGPGGSQSVLSCHTRNQKTRTYKAILTAAGSILLVALLATPFTVLIDIFIRDSALPINQISIAAIKLVVVGISHWLVNSVFMGLPFGRGLRNPHFYPAGKPTQSSTKSEADEADRGVA